MNATNGPSGSSSPTIISYLIDEHARFLNTDDLLSSNELEKIKIIYNNILCDITAYDPKHVKSLSDLENKLYSRIIKLEENEKGNKSLEEELFNHTITSTEDNKKNTKKESEKKYTEYTKIKNTEITKNDNTEFKKSYFSYLVDLIEDVIEFIRNLSFFENKIKIEHIKTEFKIKEIKVENKVEITSDRIEEAHKIFREKFNQMESRALEKKIHPELETIKELKNSQESDVKQELARLKSIPRIAKSLKKVGKQLTEKHQVAFGRSIELTEKLKDTHYIINHGQNLELMLVNIVARQLKQEFESHHYKSFEPLRHNIALRDIQENIQIVDWYKEKMEPPKFGFDKDYLNDHHFRNEILSGDCVLESQGEFESALHFFAGGKNVAAKNRSSFESWTLKLLQPIIQDYFPDKSVQDQLCHDLVNLLKRFPKGKDPYSTEGGNLYSTCVPKERFDESCYFSMTNGHPLENQETLKRKIDVMQLGEYKYRDFDEEDGWRSDCAPQIRILTHKIRPDDGYHVILNSTLTSDELKKIEEEVFDCIEAALAGYRIKKPPENTMFF